MRGLVLAVVAMIAALALVLTFTGVMLSAAVAVQSNRTPVATVAP